MSRIKQVGRIRASRLLILLLALAVTGCPTQPTTQPCFIGNPVTAPSSDSTAPTAGMDAHIPNKPMITVTSTSSTAASTVGGNDVVTLIATATDPEGAKDIQIWVEETWWITDPSTGLTTQKGPPLLGAPEKNNPDSAGPGGTSCSARLTSLNLDIKQRRQNATSYRIRTWATAINFGGTQVSTAQATLSWP